MGGLVTILIVDEHTLEESLKELLTSTFYILIKIQDWKYQQNIINSIDEYGLKIKS